MSGKRDIYRQIFREYDSMRDNAAARAEALRKEIYEKLPRLGEIEREKTLLGLKAAKAGLSSPKDAEVRSKELEEKLAGLNAEYENILIANGYEKDALKIHYSCEKCCDTGFLGKKRCSCFAKRLSEIFYSRSGIKNQMEKENFDTFDITFYSTVPDPVLKRSPRDNMKEVLRHAKNFVQDPFAMGSMLFYGNTGLGKTFLCNAIARELLQKGIPVIYASARQLFRLLEEEHFDYSKEEREYDYIEEILSVDVLIIDDLGTEFLTGFVSSELFNILNMRMLHELPVIISTNLSPGEISGHYSDRLISRILGQYRLLKFFGEDIRMLKFDTPRRG